MNVLWTWAVSAYEREGVAAACLDLQDGHGQSVPLLLWSAWLAAEGRAVDEDTLEAAADAARAWERVASAPLRAIRRTLAKPIPDMTDEGRIAVREQVKAVELAAEQRLLAELEALAEETRPDLTRTLEAALARAARAWSTTVPRSALNRLAAALSA